MRRTTAVSPPASPTASPDEPPRFLSKEEYVALLQQIAALAPGKTTAHLSSRWESDVRWAKNRIIMSGDWREVNAVISRGKGGGAASINQIDPVSLKAAVQWIEAVRQRFEGGPPDPDVIHLRPDPRTFPATALWSEPTYQQTQDTRVDVAVKLVNAAQSAGMHAAGYLRVEANGACLVLKDGRVEYVPSTEVLCSITVRAPDGKGSGWAGRSSYDWGRIDADNLAEVALEKCLRSRNPVRIEPGRYTVILEPQATFEFTRVLLGQYGLPHYFSLEWNLENPYATFHGTKKTTVPVSRYGEPVTLSSTKIGERVVDPRINLSFDPQDPDLGRSPFVSDADEGKIYPAQRVQWITNGVLTALGYAPGLGPTGIPGYGGPINPAGVPYLYSYRLDGSGTPTSLDEMIATTERGVLVTRFWWTKLIDRRNMLITGGTRDGLWLVERGKIKYPVHNMDWTDSPMFGLNKVEQIGASVPIFCPGMPGVVPPIKMRDFHFTRLADAI